MHPDLKPAPSKPKPLSVCHFCTGWPPDVFPNGVVTYVSILTRELARLGHQATVVASSIRGDDPGPGFYELDRTRDACLKEFWTRSLYAAWHRVSPDASYRSLYRRALVKTVVQAVQERGVQLLEIEESLGWAGWLQQALRIPVCVRLHGPWFLVGPQLGFPDDRAFRARVKRERQALVGAAAVSAPAHAILEQTRAYYGLPLANAVVIPNLVEPAGRPWSLEQADPLRIVFIGRFDRVKGGDLMIDAFERVLRQVPEATLWFIGPDQGCRMETGTTVGIEEYLQRRLPGALANGQVQWLGSQPRAALADFRRQALLNVVCSRYETFPYTAIEAMALGCPIVAAKVGGIPEIIQDQSNGLLHQPDDADDLAAKVVSLIRDPKRAAQLGERALIDGQTRFAPSVIAAQSVDFYRSVIERRS